MSAAKPHAFSPEGRKLALESMSTTPLDVLVIGGGITGSGIARDVALRGWSVALVDKDDIAFGTSSRSSKIVHGGAERTDAAPPPAERPRPADPARTAEPTGCGR